MGVRCWSGAAWRWWERCVVLRTSACMQLASRRTIGDRCAFLQTGQLKAGDDDGGTLWRPS
jgi:hypothetical protein